MRFGGFFRERPIHEWRGAVSGYRALREVASRVGFDVVLKTFYSPIPDLRELGPATFQEDRPLWGIDFDPDRQVDWIAERLGPFTQEFTPRRAGSGDRHEFVAENPSYGPVDARVLYATIRHIKPKRIVELGSGHSTLVSAQAVRANEAEGHAARLECFDPFPAVVSEGLPGLSELQRTRAQDVPTAVFARLEAGDVLFVDTTHVAKLGSDVNHIVLEVLPSLAPGVIVHFHDIFLPWAYPKAWMIDYGLYWSEQYLLQAFLACNPSFEIVCGLHALSRMRPSQLADALGVSVTDAHAGAFWIRRV